LLGSQNSSSFKFGVVAFRPETPNAFAIDEYGLQPYFPPAYELSKTSGAKKPRILECSNGTDKSVPFQNNVFYRVLRKYRSGKMMG